MTSSLTRQDTAARPAGRLTITQGAALYVGAVLGTGVIALPALAAQAAGPASLLAWLGLVILSVPLAATFAALGARYPDAGGVSTYVRYAFGPRAAAVVGWCFYFAVPVGAPPAAMFGGAYVAAAIGGGPSPCWPAVLRESTTETTWDGAPLPADSTVLIVTPFFHRDGQTVAHADLFAPERWLEPSGTDHAALVPFSAGPGMCPGRNLVLFVTSTLLATLRHGYDLRLVKPRRLDPRRPLPGTLDHTAIRFGIASK